VPLGKRLGMSTFSPYSLTSVEVGVACSTTKGDGGEFV
jgi:hypothetical protein